MNSKTIKKIKVKAKEKPWQFWITLAGFILLALLICTGVLIQNIGNGRISKEQQSVLMKETGALRDNLETEIQTLSRQLDEKQLTLTQSEQIMKELTDTYFSKLEENTAEQLISLREEMEIIKETVTSTKEQISKMETQIYNLTDSEIFLGEMEQLTTQITELEKEMKQTQSSVLELKELIEKQENSAQKEILERISKLEKVLGEEQEIGFSEILLRIEELFTKYESMYGRLDEQMKEQANTLSEEFEKQNKETEKGFSRLEEQLGTHENNSEDRYTNLDGKLATHEDNSEDRYAKLDGKLTTQEEGAISRFEQLKEKLFSQGGELGDGLDKLETVMTGQHQNILEVLEEMVKTVSDKLDSVSTNVTGLEERYSAIQNDFSLGFTNVIESIKQYMNVNAQNENDNKNAILSYLERKFSDVDGRLNQVFQSVSSGKKRLASALLTKGIGIREDASFEEIERAILSIPQKLLIGTETQYLPGEISYEYHYHQDGSGRQCDAPNLLYAQGCFTKPIYHQHLGNPVEGGECYQEREFHYHTGDPQNGGGCYNVQIPIIMQCGYSDGKGFLNPERKCPNCGSSMWVNETAPYVYVYYCTGKNNGKIIGYEYELGCGLEEGPIGYSLSCSKEEGRSVDCYEPGCGLTNGQIVAAHIRYEP